MDENDGQKPPQNLSEKEEQTPELQAPESVSLRKLKDAYHRNAQPRFRPNRSHGTKAVPAAAPQWVPTPELSNKLQPIAVTDKRCPAIISVRESDRKQKVVAMVRLFWIRSNSTAHDLWHLLEHA